MSSRRTSMAAQLTAAVVALFSFMAVAPAAQAAPTNIVLFGDSLLANPVFAVAETMQGPGKVSGNAPGEGRCARGNIRIGSEMQAQTGIKVEDFACSGAAAFAPLAGTNRLATQVDQALGQGKLTPGTRAVMLQIGMNDNWKAPNLYDVQKREYVNEVRNQINRVRQAAPNAKVTMVGYPDIVGPGGESCWVHWNGVDAPPIAVGPVRAALDAAHDWQRAAAQATGSSWLNLEAQTLGHGTCAPREQRWVVGIIDNTSKPFNITTHLTHEGNAEVARILSRNL